MWKKRSCKILIIDGTKSGKKAIQKLFMQQDILTDYSDISSIKEKIKVFNPDMILLDTGELKNSGLELIRRLTDSYSIPVIAVGCTGESALEAMIAGASDCIAKPELQLSHSVENFVFEVASKLKSASARTGLFAMFG